MANTTYPDLIYSEFPGKIDNFNRFVDPTPEDLPLINQYYTYQSANNWVGMKNILDNNPTLLQKMIGAEQLNRLLESIIAIERYYASDVENIIHSITDLVKYMGTWNKTASYERFSVVDYVVDNAFQCYVAKSTVPVNVKPTDISYWCPITLRGDQGAPGLGLSPMGKWNATREYVINNLVSYNNLLWAATRTNIGKPPSVTSGDWFVVFDFSTFFQYGTDEDIDNIINGSYVEHSTDTASLTDIDKVVGGLF